MIKENNQLTSSRKFVIPDINAALSAPISRIETLRDDEGRKGFTLIELLVVVLIIGILAAVALPQYNKAVKKAQATELFNAIDTMDKALASFYVTYGKYTDVPNQSIIHSQSLDIEMPVLKYWQYQNLSELQSGSFIQIGCGDGTGRNIRSGFSSNPTGLSIYAEWNMGQLIEVYCQENSGTKKCTDYFNCDLQEVPWYPCGNPAYCNAASVEKKCYL